MPKGNLNALMGKKPLWATKTETRVSQADSKYAQILIDNLVLNPNNQNYNSNDNNQAIPFEELVASIKLVGIRQPLDVEAIDNNRFMIISGERRYKAAKEAKLKTVPCIIKSSESSLIQTIAKNVTNLMVRELSVEQKYRGYCEIRDAIEAEGKSVDDPEYADLFRLTDKKSKKLFKKFEMIRRLTSDEDYELFLNGEKTYSSIEESANDVEQAMKLTKRVNDLYELSVKSKSDIEMVVYTDEAGFVYYVSENEKTGVYEVIERDYTKNVEGHVCRSSFLPPCEEKITMQAFLDRFALLNHLKPVDDQGFKDLTSKIKGESEEKPIEPSVSETVAEPISNVAETKVEKAKTENLYSEVEYELNFEKQPVANEIKKDEVTSIPQKNPSEDSLTQQIDDISEKSVESSTQSIIFEFEGEEINSGKIVSGTPVKKHGRVFLVRGNINLKKNSFINKGITCYNANCVVMEIKPETIKIKRR